MKKVVVNLDKVYMDFLNALPWPALLVELKTGRIILVNTAWESFLSARCSSNLTLGRIFRFLKPRSGGKLNFQEFKRSVNTDSFFKMEAEFISAGKKIPVIVLARLIKSDENEIWGIVIFEPMEKIFSLIMDRINYARLEMLQSIARVFIQDVKESIWQIYRGAKSLSVFLPHTSAYNTVNLIMEELKPLRKFLIHMESLTRLDSLKSSDLNTGIVSLKQCIETALDLLSYDFDKKKVKFTIKNVDKSPAVIAEESLLIDCLVNIISTAVNISGDRSVIDISCCKRKGDDGSFYVVYIRNKWANINKLELKKFFDHFYSGQYGINIGFAIFQRIIESWGGKLKVYSKKGRGLIISIALKTSKDFAGKVKHRGAKKYRGYVLVVDDDPADIETLKIILHRMQYEVLTCNSTGKLFNTLKRYASKIVGVIFDAMFRGLETSDLIDKSIQKIPNAFMILSTGFSPDAVKQIIKVNVDGIIRKPFDEADINFVIDRVIKNRGVIDTTKKRDERVYAQDNKSFDMFSMDMSWM